MENEEKGETKKSHDSKDSKKEKKDARKRKRREPKRVKSSSQKGKKEEVEAEEEAEKKEEEQEQEREEKSPKKKRNSFSPFNHSGLGSSHGPIPYEEAESIWEFFCRQHLIGNVLEKEKSGNIGKRLEQKKCRCKSQKSLFESMER